MLSILLAGELCQAIQQDVVSLGGRTAPPAGRQRDEWRGTVDKLGYGLITDTLRVSQTMSGGDASPRGSLKKVLRSAACTKLDGFNSDSATLQRHWGGL